MGAAPMRPPRYNDEQDRRRDGNRRIPPRRPSDPIDEPPRYGVPADEGTRTDRSPARSAFGSSHGDRDRMSDARNARDEDLFDDRGRVDAYGRLRRDPAPPRGATRRSGSRQEYPPERSPYGDRDDPQDQSPYSRLRRGQPPEAPRRGRPAGNPDWPPAEPAEADWRPAPSRDRRRGRPRYEPDADDPYRRTARRPARAPEPAPPGESAAPRFGAPSWSDQPPNEPTNDSWDDAPHDQWPNDGDEAWDSDDLAYTPATTVARDEPPGHRARSAPADDALAPEWDEPAERTAADEAWTTDADGDGSAADERETPSEPELAPDDPRAVVFADPGRIARSGGATGGVRPAVWGMSGYAWRFARRLTIPRTNRLLRFGANRVLPGSTRQRFLAMGIPEDEVRETLGQVRSLNDWAEAWTGTAQRFLGEARRGGDLTPAEAARDRYLAALCYHVAGFFSFGDERLARTSRSASTTLFLQALGMTMPETRKVNVRWRSKTMPAYLTVPSWANGRRPLAVILNGTSTTKEETITWQDEFLRQGLAVLALDSPGFGESVGLGPVQLEHDDILDGVFELADADPGLDPNKVAVIGISLGGSLAVRLAAAERRVAAIVAVTPPFEPARWLGASSAVVLAQLAPLFGGYDQLADFALTLDLPETVASVAAQSLIFGAGRDLVVPPPEAARLAAAMGEQATLVWFDDGGHALFDAIPDWTGEAAEWLAVILDVEDAPVFAEPDDTDAPDDTGQWEQVDTTQDEASADTAMSNPVVGGDAATGTTAPAPHPRMADRPAQANAADMEHPANTHRPDMRSGEPAPYADSVFDAADASEHRSEPQRGYDTGVFGPLGPAAARILADEPTPAAPAEPGFVVDRPSAAATSQGAPATGSDTAGQSGPSGMAATGAAPAEAARSPETASRQSSAPAPAPPSGPSGAERSTPTNTYHNDPPIPASESGAARADAGASAPPAGTSAAPPGGSQSAPAGRLTDTGSFIPAADHAPFNPIPTADYVSGGTAIRGRHRTSRSFAAVPPAPESATSGAVGVDRAASGPRPSPADALFPPTPPQPTTPYEDPARPAPASGPMGTSDTPANATGGAAPASPIERTSDANDSSPGPTESSPAVNGPAVTAGNQPSSGQMTVTPAAPSPSSPRDATATPQAGVPRMAGPAEPNPVITDPAASANDQIDTDAPFRPPARASNDG